MEYVLDSLLDAVHIRPEGDFFVTKKSKKSADGDLSGMFCYL